MFKVGQEVVCIDDSPFKSGYPFPVKKDSIHIVRECSQCCGDKSIDIGFMLPEGVWATCSDCDRVLSSTIGYVGADRFAPLISNDDLQEALDEVTGTELEMI